MEENALLAGAYTCGDTSAKHIRKAARRERRPLPLSGDFIPSLQLVISRSARVRRRAGCSENLRACSGFVFDAHKSQFFA
jgi:hypothetical protein